MSVADFIRATMETESDGLSRWMSAADFKRLRRFDAIAPTLAAEWEALVQQRDVLSAQVLSLLQQIDELERQQATAITEMPVVDAPDAEEAAP